MAPCPSCGERSRIIRTGSNNAFMTVHPGTYEWVDGRTWITSECASCGQLLEEASEPLDSPAETRLRALGDS